MALTKITGKGVGTLTDNLNVTGNVVANDGSNNARFQFDNDNMILIQNDSTMNFYVNGGNNLKIDSSGRVTKASQPAFYLNGTSFDSSTDKYLGGNSLQLLNIGSHMNTSTGVFTAPIAGRYIFIFTLVTNDTNQHFIDILKNDNTRYGHNLGYGVVYQTHSMQVIAELAANDAISAQRRGSAYGVYNAHFMGYLLG
jgi:hypothetical protein